MSEILAQTRENPTLDRLLFALKAADEELETINLDEQIELLSEGKVKVDAYKYILDKLEAHAAMLKKREQEYQSARRATEANIERVKKHLLYALEKNGFERFPGNSYAVSVRKAPPSIVIRDLTEPTAQHKLRYGPYIRTSYEWDKVALKEAIKQGEPDAFELAEVKENKYVKFTILKE